MEIDEFLIKFVEGYLFHDLESMSKLGLLSNHHDGAAGYPMIMSTLSGIELLGGLISLSIFSTSSSAGNTYFCSFWNEFLVKIDSNYEDLGSLFRKLVRHPLAHTSMTKHGIMVIKRLDNNINDKSIYIDSKSQNLVVDCVRFYKDFQKAYLTYIKPVIFRGIKSASFSRTSMQNRLNEMDKAYYIDSSSEFSKYLNKKKTVSEFCSALTSGASLSMPVSGIGQNLQTTPLTFSGEVDNNLFDKK